MSRKKEGSLPDAPVGRGPEGVGEAQVLNRATRVSKWGMNIAACLLIYANVAVILDPTAMHRSYSALPLPPKVYDAFLIYGVFSYYETNNHELQLWGHTGQTNEGIAGWIELDAREHVPFGRGERDGRLWASRHYRLLGGEDHFAVWTDLGQRVRARHNRLHPFTPISQVGLQHVSWPRSREGFYAMRQTNLSQYTFWLVATNR